MTVDSDARTATKFLVAYDLHIRRRGCPMATKIKLLKVLQEAKALAQITNRKPAPRSSLLFLMQLRSRHQSSGTQRRRLRVEAESSHAPASIKINLVNNSKMAVAD